jgi:hypothetical protein
MGQFVGLEVPLPAAIALVVIFVGGWAPASAHADSDEATAVAVVFGHVFLLCSFDSTSQILEVNIRRLKRLVSVGLDKGDRSRC